MAINTERYEEMINTLQQFLSDAGEQCSVMQGAAADLTDNMEGDPNAAKRAENLSSAIEGINRALEGINPIIQGLKSELERAQQAAAEG